MNIRNYGPYFLTILLSILVGCIATKAEDIAPESTSTYQKNTSKEIKTNTVPGTRARGLPVMRTRGAPAVEINAANASNDLPDDAQDNQDDGQNPELNKEFQKKVDEKLSLTKQLSELTPLSTVHPLAYVQLTQTYDNKSTD